MGDITAGDYWNIENAGLKIDYHLGVSLLLINTQKGKEWLSKAQEDLVLEKSDKKSCWQLHLEKQPPAPSKRQAFWNSFEKDPEGTVKKYAKGSFVNQFARGITPILRKLGLYTLAVNLYGRVKGSGK